MKKINILILTTLLALCSTPSMAQIAVGVSGGYTYNTLDAEVGYYYTMDYKSRGGYSVSLPVEYSFAGQGVEWLALRVEPSLITKNYTYERLYGTYIVDQQNYTNAFVDLPIMAKFAIQSGRFTGYLNAGGYIGYWASSSSFGYYSTFEYQDFTHIYFDERIEFDSRKDNRFEAGLVLGLGVEYEITQRVGCFVEAKYMHSLTDMQKDYMINQYPRYNSTILAQVGVMYRFK
ncbi:MAG: porin family protein [Rikenellaceae bacterium]